MSNESAPHECLILIAFFPSIGTHKWPQSISCSGFSWWTSVMNRAVSSVPILKLMLTVFWRKNTCLKLIITSLVMGSYVDVATCVLMQMQDLFQACPLPLKPGGICKWRWLSSRKLLLKKRNRRRDQTQFLAECVRRIPSVYGKPTNCSFTVCTTRMTLQLGIIRLRKLCEFFSFVTISDGNFKDLFQSSWNMKPPS